MTDIKEADAPFVLQSTKSKARCCEKRSTRSTPYRINDSRYERRRQGPAAEADGAATRSAGESDIFAQVRPERGVAEALIELVGMDDEEFDDAK